jgi:hypothetical protein
MNDRRLIKDFLPIQATCLRAARRQVSTEASREKSAHKGRSWIINYL